MNIEKEQSQEQELLYDFEIKKTRKECPPNKEMQTYYVITREGGEFYKMIFDLLGDPKLQLSTDAPKNKNDVEGIAREEKLRQEAEKIKEILMRPEIQKEICGLVEKKRALEEANDEAFAKYEMAEKKYCEQKEIVNATPMQKENQEPTKEERKLGLLDGARRVAREEHLKHKDNFFKWKDSDEFKSYSEKLKEMIDSELSNR